MNVDFQLWFEEANWDLKNAKILFKKKRFNTAVFHSQEASEKAIKALLAFCNVNGWGHSITSLLKKYKEIKKREINFIEKEATFLDQHYITTRYPDSLPGISPHKSYTKEVANLSIKQAEKILDYVNQELIFFKKEIEKEKGE